VTLSQSHQLWLAWRFESEIPNMTVPTALKLTLKESVDSNHKLHRALCSVIRVQNVSMADVDLEASWLEGMTYQGSAYKVGCHVKMADQRQVIAATILNVLAITVKGGQVYVLIYKELPRLQCDAVPREVLRLHGKAVWYVHNQHLHAQAKKKISCASYIDLQPCKLLPTVLAQDVSMLLEV
jgi:hypothetical protein